MSKARFLGLASLFAEVFQDTWKTNLANRLKKTPLKNLLRFITEIEKLDEIYADDNQRLRAAKKELIEAEKISPERILEIINEIVDVAHSKLFCSKAVSVEEIEEFLNKI